MYDPIIDNSRLHRIQKIQGTFFLYPEIGISGQRGAFGSKDDVIYLKRGRCSSTVRTPPAQKIGQIALFFVVKRKIILGLITDQSVCVLLFWEFFYLRILFIFFIFQNNCPDFKVVL